MSQAYPLMRGTAPLLVAVACGLLIREPLDRNQWLGVALIYDGLCKGRSPTTVVLSAFQARLARCGDQGPASHW